MLISDPVSCCVGSGNDVENVYTAGQGVSRTSCYVSPKIRRTVRVWRPTVRRRGRRRRRRGGRRRSGSCRERGRWRKDRGTRWDLDQCFFSCAKFSNSCHGLKRREWGGGRGGGGGGGGGE